MYLYPNLRKIRLQNNKTQKEVSAYLRIPYQQYQRYELGTREIPVHMVIMLKYYYDCTLDDLIGEITYIKNT